MVVHKSNPMKILNDLSKFIKKRDKQIEIDKIKQLKLDKKIYNANKKIEDRDKIKRDKINNFNIFKDRCISLVKSSIFKNKYGLNVRDKVLKNINIAKGLTKLRNLYEKYLKDIGEFYEKPVDYSDDAVYKDYLVTLNFYTNHGKKDESYIFSDTDSRVSYYNYWFFNKDKTDLQFNVRLRENDYILKYVNIPVYLKSVQYNDSYGRFIRNGGRPVNTKKIISTMRQNEIFDGFGNHFDMSYIQAIKISSIEVLPERRSKNSILNMQLKDISKLSVDVKYIHSTLDITKKTFYEAIKSDYSKCYENECIINAFIDHYKFTLMADNKREVLTRHKIIKMLKMTEKEFTQYGATIEDMIPIFISYRMKVRIFDAFADKIIYQYDGNNSHIKPFYCMVKNNHIYVLNYDIKSLEQKLNTMMEGTRKKAFVSENFYIKKDNDEENIYCKMIDGLDDILLIVKVEEEKIKPSKKKIIKTYPVYHLVLKNDNLNDIIFELENLGYNASISHICSKITRIHFMFNKIHFIIRSQQLIKNDINGIIKVNTEETYNKMNAANLLITKQLFNISHLSHYTLSDIDILDETRTMPIVALLSRIKNKKVCEIDINKAYTSIFSKITKIPVFNQFDIWRKYEGCDIENYTLYRVCYKHSNILLTKKYNLLYGVILKQLPELTIKILDYKKPSFVMKCDYSKIVNDLWFNEISKDLNEDKSIKKLINNVVIGQLEKGINKSQVSSIFHTLEEARNYQNVNGGSLNTIERQCISDTTIEVKTCLELDKIGVDGRIKDLEIIETSDKKIIMTRKFGSIRTAYENREHDTTIYENENDRFIAREKHFNSMVWNDTFTIRTIEKNKVGINKLYILNDTATKRLSNGFRYIKELIMQNHKLRLYKDHKLLSENNVKVYSVKTDAFTIEYKNIDIAKKLLNFSDNIGSWRLSKVDDVEYPTKPLCRKNNDRIIVPVYKMNKLVVDDEFDRTSICNLIKINKHVMIKADTPGCGKSYLCEGMVDLGYKVIFVCPTNKLVQKYGQDEKIISVTTNKFFNIQVGDEKVSDFDYSEFDVFVFDEIYFNSIFVLNKIKLFVDNNSDKIIIATGDSEQLKPVTEITNQNIDYDNYMDSVMEQIFKHEIFLKVNKRFKNIEDMNKLQEVKQILKNGNYDIDDIIKKYFKYTDVINEFENNIAYLNETCKIVSADIRKKLNKKYDYEVGEILICRKYINTGKYKFQKNFKYEIVEITDNEMKLSNVINKECAYLNFKIIKESFIFDYCCTCHSSQGSSISGKICIFDYKKDWVDWRWLWTAITRATDINNIYFDRYYINLKCDIKRDKDDNISNIHRYEHVDFI